MRVQIDEKGSRGCCTGARGHGTPFCLKVEFLKHDSPLKGLVLYSPPIEVGAKGPFAKVFLENNLKKKRVREDDEPASPPQQNLYAIQAPPTPMTQALQSMNSIIPRYSGAEKIIEILNNIDMGSYISNFLEQEIDPIAFLQLKDDDLKQIGISKMGPRIRILAEIERLNKLAMAAASMNNSNNNNNGNDFTPLGTLPKIPSWPSMPIFPEETTSTPKRQKTVQFVEYLEDSANSSPVTSPLSSVEGSDDLPAAATHPFSLCIFLSHVLVGKKSLKKVLFTVKTNKSIKETEDQVQRIHSDIVKKEQDKGKTVLHAEKAQLMLTLQPDRHGDWVAVSSYAADRVWAFKKGDLIKVDNYHSIAVDITIHNLNLEDPERALRPHKYPSVLPGASLEIGIDSNTYEHLSLVGFSSDTEIFAITNNGNLVTDINFTDTCVFSFKRRESVMGKNASFDDLTASFFASFMNVETLS